MNVKKIIKGIIGIGAVSGIAYLAYKVGEGNGEINERYRDKHDDYDPDKDDDEEYNFYDNMSFDEPDDGCLSPRTDYRITEWNKFLTEGYDNNCDNSDHFFTRLRNIDSEGFSVNDIMKAVFIVTGCGRISGRKLRDEMGVSLSEAEHLLSIFETAGYVSEKDEHNTRKVCISDMTLDVLL